MTPRRPHAQVHLPYLGPDDALTLVGILERVIDAVWRTHGDAMADLLALQAVRDPCRDVVECGNLDPDPDF